MGWPEGGTAVVETLGSGCKLLAGEISKVELLGWKEPLEWSREVKGLTVKLPDAAAVRGQGIVVLRIEYSASELAR
ncbi:hypothetical protein D3C80_1900720 [compost metagenome]